MDDVSEFLKELFFFAYAWSTWVLYWSSVLKQISIFAVIFLSNGY